MSFTGELDEGLRDDLDAAWSVFCEAVLPSECGGYDPASRTDIA